jgi:hypothetical protein
MEIDEELDKLDGPAQEGGKVSEPQPFGVKITLVGSINLEALGPFLGGKAEDGNAAGTAIMALNLMITYALCSRYPSKETPFFPPSAGRGRGPVLTSAVGAEVLTKGIAMWRGASLHPTFRAPHLSSAGYITSLRPTLGQLIIKVDVTHRPSVGPGDRIQVALAIVGEDDVRALTDVSRPRPGLARASEAYTRPSPATAAPSLSSSAPSRAAKTAPRSAWAST